MRVRDAKPPTRSVTLTLRRLRPPTLPAPEEEEEEGGGGKDGAILCRFKDTEKLYGRR